MPRYLLSLEVDGARFSGTQVQGKGERTVQGVLGEALAPLGISAVRPGSRLDQGVSAACLAVDVLADREWTPAILGLAINQKLPEDLVVVRVAPVDDRFDARNAAHKTYRYRVLSRPVRPVLDRSCWWVRDVIHPERFGDLAALLPGKHDLSGFAALRHDETDEKDPVRNYLAAWWESSVAGDIASHVFRITGEGFLYRQVRGLVGAMVLVAMGRATIGEFRATMAAGRSARRLGNIAPPEGLLLEAVSYRSEPAWTTVSVGNRISG
jgi:tRNA pseudouridine38-40 synthase